jgi:hypothetical protein
VADEKWVNVEDYLGKGTLDQQKDRMSEAQEVDAYLRRGAIHSVEINATGPSHLPKITMTINRHQECERTITIPRESAAAVLQVLMYEARYAVQAHVAELGSVAMGYYGLRRCPTCGLGPFGAQASVAMVIPLIESAPTLDAIYAAFDKHIGPLMDELAGMRGSPLKPLFDAMDRRRAELEWNADDPNQSKID